MSKLFTIRNLSLWVACCLLSLSCNKDEDGGGTFSEREYPMIFGASVEQQLTRSSTSNPWDGGAEIAIQTDGAVKRYIAAPDGKLTNASDPFYWQSQFETKTVQAWYPYSISTPTSWSVQSDQSTVGYQQSYFLYAPATNISFFNRETTALTFYHQTAKVVIDIANREAATDASHISAVKIGVNNNLALSGNCTAGREGTWSNLTNGGIITPKEISPRGSDLRSYEALVIPQDMSGKKFIAVTLSNGNTYYYTPNTGDGTLAGGKQYTYNITVKNGYLEVKLQTTEQWTDGGQQAVASKNVKTAYTATDLKPGDYYYSDGTWSDGGLRRIYSDGTGGGAGTVAPDNGKTVIGIVFWVGDPTKGNHNNGTVFTDFGDPALRNEKPQCTHGLVVALQDASTNTLPWQSTPSYVGGWVSSNTSYQSITTGIGAGDALNKLRGYNNTQAIRAYNAQCVDANKVLPVQAIDTWAVSTPAPTNSSGWYFPSMKELTLLCGRDVNDLWLNDAGGTGMRNIVNTAMENVSGATTISPTFIYWSCSENSNSSVWRLFFSNGATLYTGKTSAYNIRPILAF